MFTDADLLEMHRRMLVIRGFEERVAALYRDGEVPGLRAPVDRAGGVGGRRVLAARAPTDVITSTHRGHGHCLAKGLDPLGMFAELMGKDQGTNRGRGGSMHIADPTIGIFGANGIVGAGLPIAAGAATAAQLRRDGSVAVAFFGDGAVAHGAFHEAINLAAVWQLPVVFFCENNGYAEFSPASAQHAAPLEQRAAGLRRRLRRGRRQRRRGDGRRDGLGGRRRSAAGSGPVVVEAATYRWHGHYEGDPRALPVARRGPRVGSARPAARARAPARDRRASATTQLDVAAGVGRTRARRRGRGGAADDSRPPRPR